MIFIFNSGLHGTTEWKIKEIKVSFEPETSLNRHTTFDNELQANYSTKISPYFSMGYNFKCHKNTFYGLIIHPPVWNSNNISGQMLLSRLPWPVFLINFCPKFALEYKQLCDVASHPEFILNCFQQTAESYLRTLGWNNENVKEHFQF